MDALITGFAGLIEKFGWPGACFLALVAVMGTVSRVLFKMFFNREEDKNGRKIGYFDQWLEANLRLMGAMETGIQKVADQQENTHNAVVAFAQQHREDVTAIRAAIVQSQRLEHKRDLESNPTKPPISGIGIV